MAARIFVTGLGVLSAIGKGVEETFQSIKQKNCGIGHINYLQTTYKNIIPVAEVKYSDAELFCLAGLHDSYGITRTTLLGLIAAMEAANQAKLYNHSHLKTGLISSTSVGGMGKTEIHYKDFLNVENHDSFNQYIDSHDCGDSTEKIADHLQIRDYISTISTACSSSANAIMFGARLIRHGLLDRVVVGGTDSLTKFTLNGFNTLMILDREKCKPFSDDRNGLTLGEGAGYLVLESEETNYLTGNTIFAELTGYANANDAFHQTASSPDGKGAYLAMKKALDLSGIDPSEIDYINVHGTGTRNNDLSEGRAMKKIFGQTPPLFSSTKSYTGHTLAACAGIEAVISIQAILKKFIPPNLHFTKKMTELDFSPVVDYLEDVQVKNVLSNSFGFGGNNSALIFSALR